MNKFFVLFLLLVSFQLFGQNFQYFPQPLDYFGLDNPAALSFEDMKTNGLTITSFFHKQLIDKGMPCTPKTGSLSITYDDFKKESIFADDLVGINLFYDNAGDLKYSALECRYGKIIAYGVRLGVKIKASRLRTNNLLFYDELEPLYQGVNILNIKVGLGLFYHDINESKRASPKTTFLGGIAINFDPCKTRKFKNTLDERSQIVTTFGLRKRGYYILAGTIDLNPSSFKQFNTIDIYCRKYILQNNFYFGLNYYSNFQFNYKILGGQFGFGISDFKNQGYKSNFLDISFGASFPFSDGIITRASILDFKLSWIFRRNKLF